MVDEAKGEGTLGDGGVSLLPMLVLSRFSSTQEPFQFLDMPRYRLSASLLSCELEDNFRYYFIG